MQQLLDTVYINANNDLEIRYKGDSHDPCELDVAFIHGLAENPHADRIHRLMRLQRKLGWDIYDVDAAIGALGSGDINAEFLRNLSVVKQLHEQMPTVPILTLLSWWGDIDTTRRKNAQGDEQPSFYEQVFLNKTIGNASDTKPFELSELANNEIETVKPVLLAALKLSQAKDLDLITTKRKLSGTLKLERLSELYRVATMAKALKLSVADFLYLIDLTGFNPFDLSQMENLQAQFLYPLQIIQQSGFSISELAYILYHDFEPDSPYATGNKAIGTFLFNLRSNLRKLEETYKVVEDPTGELTRLWMSELVPEEQNKLDIVMAVIAGTPDSDLPNAILTPPGQDAVPTPLKRDDIVSDPECFPFVTNLTAFKDQFVNVNSQTYIDPVTRLGERYQEVLSELGPYLLELNRMALLQESVSVFLGVERRTRRAVTRGIHQVRYKSSPTCKYSFP